MKIGLTYDLRQEYLDLGYNPEETAEFDRPETVEAIERTLQGLGYATERIGNIWNLTKRLARGERWDLVFNIAEGLRGLGREAQVPALLDAYDIPYTFSDPLVLALTLHKGMSKRVIRDLGLPTPDFAEVRHEGDVDHVGLGFPLLAKPIAEGSSKGITAASKVHTKPELRSVCRHLLATYHQPVLVETFLPGREFTVGLVGTGKHARVVGIMEVMLKPQAEKEVYSYVNKAHYETCVGYRAVYDAMAKRAMHIALQAWRGLGCRDAGRIDLRADASGRPHFMEVNPLAGMHPQHSDLIILCRLAGVTYAALIEIIINEALARLQNNRDQGLASTCP